MHTRSIYFPNFRVRLVFSKRYTLACTPSSLIRVFEWRSKGNQWTNVFQEEHYDSDQTAWMRRLILIFDVCTCQLIPAKGGLSICPSFTHTS